MNIPGNPLDRQKPPEGPFPDAVERKAQGLPGFQDPLATPPGDPAADSVEQRIRNPHAPLYPLDTPPVDPLLVTSEDGIEHPAQVPPEPGPMAADAQAQMMDLLERNVEGAPTQPPMTEDADADRQAELLDLLERSIEDEPPLSSEAGGSEGCSSPAGEEAFAEESMAPPPPGEVHFVSQDCEPPDVNKGVAGEATRYSHRQPPAFVTRKIGRPRGASARGLRRRTSSRPRKPERIHSATPYCPETREIVDIRECATCGKFRHWPDGTDEEPRTCWHLWRKTAQPPEDIEEEEPD